MNWIEFTSSSPAENLALDEALLDYCEDSAAPGFLRFWESTRHFVVLGYGNKLESEVHAGECESLGIPILRRCSGGGTVVQGPGCFNYNLCLPIASCAEFETITGTNRFIMERNRRALAELSGLPVEVHGYTDLAIQGVKFSGNAQRRKKNYLLFHGSLLLNFELVLIERVLRFPTHQPTYRAGRTHSAFIRNFTEGAVQVCDALTSAWSAEPLVALPAKVRDYADKLMHEKYLNTAWHRKF